jgi:hypothetical protein
MEKFNGRMCPVSIDDAETAFDYQPEVSGSSSFVYGVEQFKESLKESIPQASGVVGGLLYKAGKEIDKYFPDGIKLFNGSVDVKIADKLKRGGEILVNAADRNVEAMQREFRRNNPRLEKAQENLMFDIGNQGANWTTMLLSGRYAGYVMGNLVLGGEFQERADKYKQEHGGSLEGFAQEYGDEAGYNLANAFVQGVEERYLGSFAQVKSIKKGMGFVKAIGKNAVQEGFIEEPLQDVTDFYFDKLTGFNENEELKDRLKGNLRGYVVASLFGGAGGFGAAVYQRAEGIDYYKEALKNTVPEKDLEKVATKAYEQDAKTLREIVTVEIENSSSLENKRGEVYENMYKASIDAVNRARKQGGYSDLRTEEEVAAYAKAESDNFANWVLEEANRRNTTIQNVLDASSIYSDETGLHIGMTKDTVAAQIKETIKKKKRKATSLVQFLRQSGGVRDDGGELRGMDAQKKHIGLINKNGISLDEAGEKLWNAGYFMERPTPAEVLDAIDDELRGNRKYPLDYVEEEEVSDADAEAMLDDSISDYAEAMGYDLKGMSFEEKAQIYDQMQRNMSQADEEYLELAQEMERLDDLYPEYEGETININGKERTVYNSNGDRIAKSKEALENFYRWFGDSKVVDEQGRPKVMYHGTPNAIYDTLRAGTYFTDNKAYAEVYKGQGASSISYKKEALKPDVYAVYIKMEKPFDTRNKEARDDFYKYYYQKMGMGTDLQESGLPDWNDGRDLLEFITEEHPELGYDGILLDEGGVGGYGEEVKSRGISYVNISPNQIKSTSNRGTYSESENIYYQFAGEKAQTAALDELENAKQLEADGVDNEEIRQQTGWFKGVDGKWRFEISDEDAKMLGTIEELRQKNEDKHEKTLKKLAKLEKEREKLRIAINKNEITENEYYSKLEENDKKIQTLMDNDEAFKVKDIISHEKLFDAYPWIANINVFISERIDPDEAYYDERTKSITVGKNVAKEPASSINLKGIILHEIQHAIQATEGFARGGSPDDFDSIEQLRRGLEQGKQLLDEANEALETAEDLGYSDDTDINGMPVSFYREQKEQAQKQIDYANERISNYKDPYQKYKSLYGEIEARNTAIRSEFTEELRGKIPPESTQDVANADAIVIFDDGVAMAYKPETYYQSAFAGSRVDYDRPSLEAIGSGEGNQAHGWGLYYALDRDVAEGYKDRYEPHELISYDGKFIIDLHNTDGLILEKLANKKITKEQAIKEYKSIIKDVGRNEETDFRLNRLENIDVSKFKKEKGQVHEVDIPENPYLLDEQEMLIDQSDFVQEKIEQANKELDLGIEDSGIRGDRIYQKISDKLGSDKAASEYLEKIGIKGITYDGRQDGRCFVIFNPDDVKVIQKFYQRGKSTRGSIQFKGQEAIIRLTESANASTLAHELAHYYLQNTFLYNKSGLASNEYSTYFKPIADYLGIDPNQETIKEWQQEKFARAYEQYLLKGKAETPELQAAFNNYNKWIKRAYRMLKSKPKYRNEEGKLVEPRLTPEIMEAFGKLTGGFVARPDIEAMAETVTPELENAVVEYENQVTQEQERIQKETVYPTTEIRETAEEGTTGKSGVAFRVLGEELGYDVKHIEDQMDKAREFVRKNLSEAKEIVNGKQAPEGMLSSAINLAYVEVMENSGNYQEAERATRLRSMEQTRRGQEIAMEKATTDNILNAETWSNLVLSRKSAEAARKYFKNDLKALQDFIKRESANIAKQIVNKPKEERAAIIKENLERITQETGILFQEDYSDLEDSDYYNEVLNETQLMIEKSMGIGLDEDQIDYIHDNVRQLQDIVKETVSNNGNISIEAFKQIRKMYDTIESYTPSSNVAVWSSIIGRGAMLASIKSPILNIISNAENMITETLSRKALNIVTGQSNDNIVDSNIINDYLKWSYNVYQASGYMPSVTSDILGGRPILGEKRLTSQGQGKVRAIGRFAEDIVFKELMGLPDSVSKDWNFVSVAGNKATQQAYKEGLSGDKAKARANELFKDAILLRPMTEDGERIRGESMAAAHEATFTQDSEISKIALRIRDVLNSKEFKAGDFLVPFVKTPANVVALGMEYSLGSIYTVYHIKDIINNPQSDVSQAAIKAGVRNGLGMILAMMLAGLVDDDDYIPEYDNASPKQRDIAKLKNAPFNSIRIGNKWINLDYFGPLAIPMAGILTARAKQDLTGFLQGVSGQALKTPGVKEINSLIGDVSRAVQYGVSYKKIAEDVFNWGVEQTASRTIPAIITDFGKLIDKYERETGGEMARRVMAKIPVLREELPIKTDITGRKIETEPTNILFGSRVKTAVDDAVVKEIDRLNKTGNAPTISDPTRYGKFRSLETEEKDKIRTKFNQEYGRKAREKIASSAYKRLDDAQKKKELNKIRKKISDDLKKQK